MLLLLGRVPGQRLAAEGYQSARVLAFPKPKAPRLLVPMSSPAAMEAAFAGAGRRPISPSLVKRVLGLAFLKRGIAPDQSIVTIAARLDPRPWLLRKAALEAKARPTDDWFLWLGTGDPLQRAVLHLMAPGGGCALKFSRIIGNKAPFQNEEFAARVAARLPGEIAQHVPRLLAEGANAELPYVLETRFAGRRLSEAMRSNWSVARKLNCVKRVADWLHDVAVATKVPPTAVAVERARIATLVAPLVADSVVMQQAMSAIEAVPGVLVHNDVGTWNIVIDRHDGFGVVDWESSRERGMPLWDLAYFLADALSLLEGRRHDDYTGSILRLFRGESRHSTVLFENVRRAVEALDIERSAVGPLVTLGWLYHALSPNSRQIRLRAAGVKTQMNPNGLLSAIADPWIRDPDLGFSWQRWQ